MRTTTLKIALLAASATLAGATPALADDSPEPAAGTTMITFSSYDNANTDKYTPAEDASTDKIPGNL